MDKRLFTIVCLIATALVCMGQSSSCRPPMDATGDYSGTWSIEIKDNETDNETIEIVDCPLQMVLEQDVALNRPKNFRIDGMVHIDFSCLEEVESWPDWIDIPAPTDVTVTGTMNASGRVVLASGGCGPGTCIILALDGDGASGEETGEEIPPMTSFTGQWGIAIGVAFLGNAGDTGPFAVFRE